jgi:hypothetical protein
VKEKRREGVKERREGKKEMLVFLTEGKERRKEEEKEVHLL